MIIPCYIIMEKQLSEILKRLDTLESRLKKIERGDNEPKRKIIIKKQSVQDPIKNISIKTGNIVLTLHPNGCIITGDTFDKKDIIKKYKGWWTPDAKGWTVRVEHYTKIKADLEKSSKSLEEKTNSNDLVIDTNKSESGKSESGKSESMKSGSSRSNMNAEPSGFLSDSD